MVRAEGVIHPNRGTTTVPGSNPARDTVPVKFSNYGLNVGLSLMLGSKPIPDSDGDGILNNRDRCAGTPAGAQVDGRGCPGRQRWRWRSQRRRPLPQQRDWARWLTRPAVPRTAMATTSPMGSTSVPIPPTGVLVDSSGCPKDSDGDTHRGWAGPLLRYAEGRHRRCPGLPGRRGRRRRARWPGPLPQDAGWAPPSTPPAVRADSKAGSRRRPADTSAPARQQPRRSQPSGPGHGGRRPWCWRASHSGPGAPGCRPRSYVELDSIAKVLAANPSLRVEIGGHTDEARHAGRQHAPLDPESRGGTELPGGQGSAHSSRWWPEDMAVQHAADARYHSPGTGGQPKDRDRPLPPGL